MLPFIFPLSIIVCLGKSGRGGQKEIEKRPGMAGVSVTYFSNVQLHNSRR